MNRETGRLFGPRWLEVMNHQTCALSALPFPVGHPEWSGPSASRGSSAVPLPEEGSWWGRNTGSRRTSSGAPSAGTWRTGRMCSSGGPLERRSAGVRLRHQALPGISVKKGRQVKGEGEFLHKCPR